MSDDKTHLYTYSGDRADVTWDDRLCIHIGECGRSDDEIFVGGRKPWCQPDLGQSLEAVDELVRRCPTGALVLVRHDDETTETPPARNTVTVASRGPLYLRGELVIDGAADDMAGVPFRAALCRCGKSENKPFCDNAHEKNGFDDRGAVGRTGEALEVEGGPLEVKRAKDGPLLLSGNFTILSGSGREAWTGTRAALCRCGLSDRKPFCDGSHRAGGFEAD